MKKQILALMVECVFLSFALMANAASNDVGYAWNTLAKSTMFDAYGGNDTYGGNGKEPPGGYGGGGGGKTNAVVSLTGVLQVDSGTKTYDGGDAGGTLTSTNSDENVILVQNGASLTISNYTLNKSGDTSSEDNSNFFAVNAVVAVKTNATIHIDNSTLNSNADGANALFASGSNSTIYAYNCKITSTKDSSRGLDATYEGTVVAAKMTIKTSGSHCASLATDRGNGYISVTDATLSTAGEGSALIYSTGVIEANSVTGIATRAQVAGIEGLSTIRITNSNLSGSGEKASEPVANGVIIYQSMSGDSKEGEARFEVSNSTLASAITNGAMFYITNTKSDIRIQNTILNFDSTTNYLIKAAGNDGTHGWGTVGANGATVTFTAIDQTLSGNISVDGISSLDMYLTNSTYTGAFVQDTTYTGNGGSDLFICADSMWVVTTNCTLQNLTAAEGAQIVDSNGAKVSIVGEDGTVYVSGTSNPKVTIATYTVGSIVATNTITNFEISRSAFEALYESSQSQGSKTYYIKPHAPENAVLKVRIKGEEDTLTPDMDHKYWLDDYWDEENGVTVELIYATDNGYFFVDGSSRITQELTITTNKLEIDPPASTATIKAQAKSGNNYYLTLKEALEAAKDRSKIELNDNLTLEESLTVTNSITLDLNTNVVTLSSSLTNAFHFTASTTISNGTINSARTANAEGSILLRATDSKILLKDLAINGKGFECVVAHDSTQDAATKYNTRKAVSHTVTCDNLAITGNGCLLSIDYANATLTNNCSFTPDNTLDSFGGMYAAAISCCGNGTVTIIDGTYTSPKVLQSGDFGGKIIVQDGVFSGEIYSWMAVDAHTNLNENASYKAQFTFNGGTYTLCTIAFAYADSLDLSSFTKGEEVTLAAPSGYVWQENTLVKESLTPGISSAAYSSALLATNAAALINADKDTGISVPAGIELSATQTYLSKVMAFVTSDNCVVIDLTPAAEVEVESALNEAITNEMVAASLISTNTSVCVTIPQTTPGLYYWITGGVDINAITNVGLGVLSTNGGAVELSKPTLDATKNRAFFKVSAGVAAP